jgi:hypothetical protein
MLQKPVTDVDEEMQERVIRFTFHRFDTPNHWRKLERTPIGRMVAHLITQWDRVAEADNDNRDHARSWVDHLMLCADVLAAGHAISRDDRRLIYEMAWKNRHLLPPELAMYAALGGGIQCDD